MPALFMAFSVIVILNVHIDTICNTFQKVRSSGERGSGSGGGARWSAGGAGPSRRSTYERLSESEDDDLYEAVPAAVEADRRRRTDGRGSSVGRRPSVLLPSLREWERRFFDLVARGDVEAVKEFLQENPGFNINCVNYQGLSALHQAVQSRCEPMVELLLSLRHIDVGDCALHAARDDQPRLLALLLDRLRAAAPELEFAGCVGSPDFPDGTTPLLLAAQGGFYETIGLLISRGHQLQRPHPVSCNCKEVCKEEHARGDRLAAAMARLGLYRAWCNPAFLCHSSDDPVLTAFLLWEELCGWARRTPALRSTFIELAYSARRFAVDIMACCRTSREVELLLRRRAGCDFPGHVRFPRLMLAMDYNQKEFVAHPNTQQVLESAWSGDWGAWRGRSQLLRTLTVLPRIAMLPAIAIACIVAPHSAFVRHAALPVNKLINWVASYLVFLGLVFAESNLSRLRQLRGPPNSGLEPVLVVYVVGYMWSSARLCMLQGPRRFFSVLTNWYDAVTHIMFACAFLFWLAALLDVEANDARELERKYWHHLDPTLVGEGFFALATILAFARLLLLLQFNFHLGPLQVSLGKMAKDITKFVIIFMIIMLSFAAGLCRLYEYYDGMTQHDPVTGNSVSQVSSFVGIGPTLKTLFWCIFCMSPLESADVIIENLPAEGDRTVINHHSFTEAIGHICFALFMVFSVIVILNMLIATICNTFQKVTDNVDVEWTFGRTEVYLVYLSQTTLPPPFNLLPTAGGVMGAVRWCSLLGGAKGGRRARFSLGHCCYVEVDEGDEESERDYAAAMSQLVQRYFREREPSGEAAQSDMEALRREVQQMREALLLALEPEVELSRRSTARA